jgi:hypothetical protein
MKQLLKQYAGGLILLALLTALTSACLWSSRPVRLDAAELTPAETLESLPGLELYLDTHRGHTLSMTVMNRSGLSVESGGSVDQDATLYLDPGLDVLLNGAWYNVPYEPYASAGVGLELAPGEEIEGQTGLSQYGRLPDGQYRLSFVYWQQAHGDERPRKDLPLYASYTGLEILDGNYILPTSSP